MTASQYEARRSLILQNIHGKVIIMGYDREKIDIMLKVLREEYGITTEKELDEAIKKQGFINITPFVAPPSSTSQPPSHSQQ